ncbi:MAG: trypsin-like peptidase domain-containing protein [Spirochaetes bacterium]|uniref:Trypsin-like peptidase domain-containing protein n=1 Tax=Candidatus Ornithospirochaeta stercoripullorum TaxID=2840899 RepID=A0A9D9DZ11_9SPIO|nr:trypsin-like peptidase domain-containing protein [Candidatus Ornithospirochaeta stercoripullorum]
MRFRSLLIVVFALFLISCQTVKDDDIIFEFPENTTLEDSTFWISGLDDPLGLSSVMAEQLSLYGFNAVVVPDFEVVNDYASITSTGSAFAISSNLLVTNSHVVDGADHITVVINGDEVEADVLRNEADVDIAILRISDMKLPFAFEIGATPAKGTPIAVLGYPMPDLMGEECKYTNGIVSADSGIGGSVLMTQISAEIQPGNSGGPVFTEDFKVIGIATEKLSDLYSLANAGVVPQSVNYAVKSETLNLVAADLLADSEKTESVKDLSEAEQAVFLVKSGDVDSIADDVFVKASYTYNWYDEAYYYSWYYVDPLTIALETADGKMIGEMTESSYAGNPHVSETAYETVGYIVTKIFNDWVSECLPLTNTGEKAIEG